MLKKFFTLAFMLVTLIFVGEAKAGIVTDRFPLFCYVDHQVDTYNQPNGQRVGYISPNVDLVRVTQVRGDGWAYGDYPGRNGRVARWFRINELCADPGYSNRGTNIRDSQNIIKVFRTKNGGDTIGSVSNNEEVIVLADNGNRAQILYKLNNNTGWKMGWVPSSTVAVANNNRVIVQPTNNINHNPQGTVEQANSPSPGVLHVRGRAYDLDNARSSVRLHVYVGGGAGSGAPGYEIRTDGGSNIFDDTRQVSRTGNQPVYVYALNDYGGGNNVEIWHGNVNIQGNNPVPVNINVGLLKQNDPQWKNVPISTNTIGGVGCTITSLAMKYNYHNNTNITPPEMMRKLSFSGNSVIWSSVNRLGYTTYMDDNRPQPDNNWLSKIYTQLKAGKPVIVGAYQINSSGKLAQHWVVVKGYSGNSTSNFNTADFQINDPMNPFSNLQQFFGKYNKGLRGIIY